uniref:MFS domain-containing protein n=1 Tax=Macrostomum lignano TaxID=282301 RepID=A0A1I8GRM9_9PLAT
MAPETPRWLLSRGRKRAAGRIVRQMLLDNGRTGEQASAAVKELLGGSGAEEDDGKTAASDGRHSMRRSLGLLARSPRLLLRYGIIGIDWFLVAAIYYGISMGAKNLPGSIFVTSCLIGIVDLPSYLIMHLAADRLGRKTTFIGAIGGSGLALVGLAIANHLAKDLTWLVIALSLLGKMLNSTAFAIIYIWTGELYATNMRSSGLSTSSMCARFGTLFAPLLGNIVSSCPTCTTTRCQLSVVCCGCRKSQTCLAIRRPQRDFIPGEFGPLVSYAVFAGSSFLAAAISFAVPETRGVAIPDSVEDLINTNRLEAVEAEEAGAAGADLLAKEEKT